MLRRSATLDPTRINQFIANNRWLTFGEKKICSTIKRSQNIMKVIVVETLLYLKVPMPAHRFKSSDWSIF